METFRLEISMRSAIQTPDTIADALRETAYQLRFRCNGSFDEHAEGTIRDVNDEIAGHWEIINNA